MLPSIRYRESADLIAIQKQALKDRIKKISLSHVVYPSITKFPIDPSEIPGLKEGGWTPEMDLLVRETAKSPLYTLLCQMLNELRVS